MLANQVVEALNAQMVKESESCDAYLAMASWCEQQKLMGCAKFFYVQAEEERGHMLKLFKYVNDNEGVAVVPMHHTPKASFASIQEVFEVSLTQERSVSAAIHALVDLCTQGKHFPTLHFLQWYVEEQQEEERTFTGILDQVKLIGLEGQGLYLIDQAVGAYSPSSTLTT